MNKTIPSNKKYGIFDNIDKCWIGSLAGPNVYVDKKCPSGEYIEAYDIARMAKTVLLQMLAGKNKGRTAKIMAGRTFKFDHELVMRYQIKEIDSAQKYIFKDTVSGKIDCITALKELESGSVNY